MQAIDEVRVPEADWRHRLAGVLHKFLRDRERVFSNHHETRTYSATHGNFKKNGQQKAQAKHVGRRQRNRRLFLKKLLNEAMQWEREKELLRDPVAPHDYNRFDLLGKKPDGLGTLPSRQPVHDKRWPKDAPPRGEPVLLQDKLLTVLIN